MNISLHVRNRMLRTLLPATIMLIATLVLSSFAQASAGAERLIKISSDPFTNVRAQHQTEVEPDVLSFGNTLVSAFQVGRFFSGGATDIGWATSHDGGHTWSKGFLPATTPFTTPVGPFDRISDPVVAYDSKHKVWLISYVGLHISPTSPAPTGVDVVASRSTDGGLTWGNPIVVAPAAPFNALYDKSWTVCDTTYSSPFYGNCYAEFDNNAQNNTIMMSTSTDGGLTWGAALPTADHAHGIGGQPLVQPSGKVIVPIVGEDSTVSLTISAFTSTNGGASWSSMVVVSEANDHQPAGGIRADVPFPSAGLDRKGNVYVVWADCRFESNCAASDMLFSTSADGVTWSPVTRIPIDAIGSGVDHFIPGLAVDRTTNSKGTHLGLAYYYYPQADCLPTTCQLNVGFVSSVNGGASWSQSEQLAGPMNLSWLAATSGGAMVGDYIATAINAHGKAFPVFALAHAPQGTLFDEAMDTTPEGTSSLIVGGSVTASATEMPKVSQGVTTAVHSHFPTAR